jgi:nucleoside-diphosphate-sugar epimerase
LGRLDARTFNFGAGIGTLVTDVAETLLRVAKTTVPMDFAPARSGEQRHSFLNLEKAGQLLGCQPSVSLDDGLAETLAWFAGLERSAGSGSLRDFR